MVTLKKTNREIEERYELDDREISQERSDFLMPQIVDFISKEQWINLRPEYQRRQVWDKSKQSRFIESLLMNLPVPPIFLFESEYSRYEVMDGQQRLSSILAFYQNRLKLIGLEHWKELQGKYYSDLPPKLQRGLDRRRISAVVLQTPHASTRGAELRQIVFERLNTGGQRLNAQELRNCLYSSPFATLLVELASNPTFNDLCGIPRYAEHFVGGNISPELAENTLFKRMVDCELVLRFFAFRNVRAIKGSVKLILDKCMQTNAQLTEDGLLRSREDFNSRVDMAFKLFGTNAFKLPYPDEKKTSLSEPYYDAVMVVCDRLFDHREALIKERVKLGDELKKQLLKPENRELVVGKANTADAIKKRFDFVELCFTSVL